MKHLYGTLICLLLYSSLPATERPHEPPSPPKIGNFANENTPGVTFGFGQLIYDKNTFIVYPILSQITGDNFSGIDLCVAAIYGITDNFSLYIGLPIILKYKENKETQRGIGNLFVELEYAFLSHSTIHSETLATIVGAIGFPTTHLSSTNDCAATSTATNVDCVQTTTSTGVPTSFFIGATASHVSIRYYIYGSLGATWYTKKNDVKTGTAFVYQWAVGQNMGTPWGLTALGLLEFNGEYSQKDSTGGCPDPDTGGNVIFAGPSLCLCSTHWYLSGGIQLPIVQKLNGTQDKTKFRSSLILSIDF